jgi:hypothetical protein
MDSGKSKARCCLARGADYGKACIYANKRARTHAHAQVGRVAASQEVQITLALKLEETGVKQLQRHFLACSNPRDKDYAQHWCVCLGVQSVGEHLHFAMLTCPMLQDSGHARSHCHGGAAGSTGC